jgi:hypothetical protein
MILRNEGGIDRVVRVLAGLGLGLTAWVAWPGALSILLLLVGGVALVTGLAGWCPAYGGLGISTCRTSARHRGDAHRRAA